MTIPKSLFKYQPFSSRTISNLQEQSIYFSSPSDFNDPYDCAISTEIGGTLTETEVDELFQAFKRDVNPDPQTLKDFQQKSHEECCEIMIGQAKKTLEEFRHRFLHESGVACFSETNDNMLMWSHYANGGRGICLEFDTDFHPFSTARIINYEPKIPVIQARPLLIGDDIDQYIDLFCIKSDHWAYEREWRSLHKKRGTSFVYPVEALKAVYFGSEIKPTNAELICLILAAKYPEAKVFKGMRNSGSFEVEFHEIEYKVAG